MPTIDKQIFSLVTDRHRGLFGESGSRDGNMAGKTLDAADSDELLSAEQSL